MGSISSTESTPDPHKKELHPGGSRGASMDAWDPINLPEDLNEIWEVIGALPGALAFIKTFMVHIQTLNQANDGLKHSVDAQYSLIQNFFERKEPLMRQPQSSGRKQKKDSKGTRKTSGTELCCDDLNQHENKTIESLQNVIMSQTCMISMAVENVNTTLKSAIPDKHWKTDTKSQNAKQLIHKGDKEGNIKHAVEVLNKEEKQKQACSATKTKEAGINCFLLGDLQFVHKNLEEYVSNGRQNNFDAETHTEDLGEINNDDKSNTFLNKQLNITQENEHLSAIDKESSVAGKMKSPGIILQELGKLFDDARNQCDKLSYTETMESELIDTIVQFQTKFDNILSKIKGLEDGLNVRKKSEDSENEMDKYLAMKSEKEQIEKEFSLMRKTNDDLNNKLREKENALSEAVIRVQDLEKSISVSSYERQQTLQKVAEKDNELADLNNKLRESKNTLLEAVTRVQDLEESISDSNYERQQTLQKIAKKDIELADYQKQVLQYKIVIKGLEQDNSHWNLKYEDLSLEHSKTEAAQREKEVHILKLEDIINELKLQSDQLKIDTSNLKEDLRSRKCEVRKLRETNEDLRNQKRELSHKCRELRENLEAVEIRMSIVTEERDMLRKRQDEIDAEMERQRRRKQVSVFLYTPRRGDLFSVVVGEIRTKLLSHFNSQSIDVIFEEVYCASNIMPNRPTIVLCINASRLGTDVSNALAGLKANSDIAVVVLHHKEVHALPKQSSERVLTSVEYKALGGIFDMACLSSRGLYPCDMNTHAINGLVDFIKQRNTGADHQ